jgi:hypothetical protein
MGGAGAAALPEAARLPVAGADVTGARATGAAGTSSSDSTTTGSEPVWAGGDGGTGFAGPAEP